MGGDSSRVPLDLEVVDTRQSFVNTHALDSVQVPQASSLLAPNGRYRCLFIKSSPTLLADLELTLGTYFAHAQVCGEYCPHSIRQIHSFSGRVSKEMNDYACFAHGLGCWCRVWFYDVGDRNVFLVQRSICHTHQKIHATHVFYLVKEFKDTPPRDCHRKILT